MRVEFWKSDAKSRLACGWDAYVGKGGRTHVPGAYMAVGRTLPHDLLQYVAEAATNYENGFWGLIARGATFKSTGRRRTKPGRALIAQHRDEIRDAERVFGAACAVWNAREPVPITDTLDTTLEQWRALRPGERLVFTWPHPEGEIVGAAAHEAAIMRTRRSGARPVKGAS